MNAPKAITSGLFLGGAAAYSGLSFILGLEHPVVSGAEIISEGTKQWTGDRVYC